MSHTAHPHQTRIAFQAPGYAAALELIEQVEWQAAMVLADETADRAEVAAANDLIAVCRLARRELARLCRHGDCTERARRGHYCERCHADIYWDGGPF